MTRPDEFYASIGGYMGNSYRVELEDDLLIYTQMGRKDEEQEVVELEPSDEQWSEFLATLDDIDVWAWQQRYKNPGICDGTSWSFRIAVDDRRLETSGSNNYPGLSHTEAFKRDEKSHAPFQAFTEALRKLIGGREFS